MSAPQNFRTAFNGFNREDVVRYLEYLTAKHNAQVNQLTQEVDYLRRQVEQLSAPAGEDAESLRLQLEESLSIRKALEARCSGLQQELDDALAGQAPPREHQAGYAEQELEAYRRAERMERLAQERARQIYDKTNGVLADATAQVDAAAAQLSAMADAVGSQLEQLRCAVGSSKRALQDAAAAMYTIKED